MLSLAFALGYSLLGVHQAFSGEYVIQDDARQHVFWMQRYLDPTLFPNDLIADYFQSVAPAGYRWIYRLAAGLGLDPLLFHKLLPIGLNLVIAGLGFRVCLGLFPVPVAAFASTVLLGQGLGLTDAVISGTPKAFVYPLLLLFMDGVIQRRWLVSWSAIALQGLFYPQLVLISAGALCLRLVEWRGWYPRLVTDRRDRILALGGLLVAGLVLLPYAMQTSTFGPTLTLEEARQLPELSMEGSRSRFFYDDDPATYWLKGRSGFRLATIFTPVTNLFGIALLALPWLSPKTYLSRHTQPSIVLLPQLLVSSITCFFLAHLLLFRLHLPSRYTQHSLRVIVGLAASIVIVSLCYSLCHRLGRGIASGKDQEREGGQSPFIQKGTQAVGIVASLILAILVLCYPVWVAQFPLTGYQYGAYPKLYSFLQRQPPSSLVASLASEVNNLPSFTQRSILTGSEYAIPYHVGYYRQLRERTTALINAQYGLTRKDLRQFLKAYPVTFWLLEKGAFQPDYITQSAWIQQHPQAANRALSHLLGKKRPRLTRMIKSCRVLQEKQLILLDAACIRNRLTSR